VLGVAGNMFVVAVRWCTFASVADSTFASLVDSTAWVESSCTVALVVGNTVALSFDKFGLEAGNTFVGVDDRLGLEACNIFE